MKHFFRTVWGKTILFLGCIFSILLLLIAGIGIGLMFEMEVYTKPENQVYDDVVRGILQDKAYELVEEKLYTGNSVYPSEGNLKYKIYNKNGRLLCWSEGAEDIPGDQWEYEWGILTEYNMDGGVSTYYVSDSLYGWSENYQRVFFYLDKEFPYDDVFSLSHRGLHLLYVFKTSIYFLAFLILMLGLIFFIGLMCVSGRRTGSEEVYTGPFTRVPLDLLVLLCLGLGVVLLYVDVELFRYNTVERLIVFIGICMLGLIIGIGLSMSIATRIKLKMLFSNTVVAIGLRLVTHIGKLLFSLVLSLSANWLIALFLAGTGCLELIVLLSFWNSVEDLVSLFFLEKIIIVPVVLLVAKHLRQLEKAGKALADGDLLYKTDTSRMYGAVKRHGENLNSIADGMTIVVEERMKSEHMKTELITNVSHDIKTPLTSIINYAGLIGNETCENPKILEYSEVLVRQSERLKRLIEDLVEASKASTGNLEVNLAPCDAGVFLPQAAGEFEEKFEKAQLSVVIKQPEEEAMIMADPRRMWRIFDNLLNNICKYAQQGTRVYLSLEIVDDQVQIVFKNTSRESLDVSEEELMERFVRGDSSRNTEGNGLGLSIAKSMAELQNGKLRVVIDGDLFKAILTFPLIKEES